MMTDYENLQDILLHIFKERSSRNPHYSLRAYARNLSIPASTLGQVLKGRQGLSLKSAERVAENLELTKTEREYFLALIQSKYAKAQVKRELAKSEVKKLRSISTLQEHHQLSLEYFKVVGEWYHMAILELTYLDDFRPELKWVSQKLHININIVRDAVERLFKLKLLQDVGGTWVDTFEKMQTPSDLPSAVIKKFHQQIMALAQNSLLQAPVQQREVSTNIFAIRKKDIKLGKDKIREFRSSFANQLGKGNKKDSVYALNINFFELTHDKES